VGNARGFTLIEVIVATAMAALVASAVFVLLDSGLRVHEKGTDMGTTAQGLSEALAYLRADVSRSSSVIIATHDSLEVALPDGSHIAWASRPHELGLAVYRSLDTGSGFVERPLRPVLVLADHETHLAALVFQERAGGAVRAHMTSFGRNLSIEAAPWSTP
jgi:prepilin-type N-terminal cleavage/methylation domain-containing protein